MNYESEFILRHAEAISPFWRSMINLSSFIAFHARRAPERCALKYRGEDISYAAFDEMPWRFVDYWAMTYDADLDRYHLTKA